MAFHLNRLEPPGGQPCHSTVAPFGWPREEAPTPGFQCGTPFVGTAFGTNIVFDQNTVNGNGTNPSGGGYRQAINVLVFDGVQITGNQVSANVGDGILLSGNAPHTLVKGNMVAGTQLVTGLDYWTGVGIMVADCSWSTITQNTVTGNQGSGLWQVISDS